jgi:Zn-dependent membrane protease YugP
MHPVLILIPIAGLALGPSWWAKRVLKQHNQSEAFSLDASQLARIWLDRNRLEAVGVEITDLGDHYDPETRMVRLTRDKHARKTLTAVTTAAHEVAHALQDFEGYAPFVWRNRLARFAALTGQVGTVILMSVPAATLLGRRPLPPLLLGSTLWVMLGSGMLAQFSALMSELDASFGRALPLVQDVAVSEVQLAQARRILLACSLTYAASSLLSVLHFWPWLGPRRLLPPRQQAGLVDTCLTPALRTSPGSPVRGFPGKRPTQRRLRQRQGQGLVRTLGKPMIRAWFRVVRATG